MPHRTQPQPIQPLPTPTEYRALLARIRELMARGPDRLPGDDELERLAARVVAYEQATPGKGGPDPVEEAQVRREKLSPPAVPAGAGKP